MLQDTAAGGAFLARERQAQLRATIGWRRSVSAARRSRTIRFRPATQPSVVVQPRPAELRKLFPADLGS